MEMERSDRDSQVMANPPTQITRDEYISWLDDIGSNKSAFLDLTFQWYNTQLQTPLPQQVYSDPDKLYFVVQKALDETIALEQAGEIAQGNTMGFDGYGIIDVPPSVALETQLFFLGKPVGKDEGATYPCHAMFYKCYCTIRKQWGPQNYFSITSLKNAGGFVQDLNDESTILVRGNEKEGYIIFGSFFAEISNISTATEAQFFIAMLRPMSDGKTELRQNFRRNGQSYMQVGLEHGRREYGFNVARFRRAQKALNGAMMELKNTGKIRECPRFTRWIRFLFQKLIR